MDFHKRTLQGIEAYPSSTLHISGSQGTGEFVLAGRIKHAPLTGGDETDSEIIVLRLSSQRSQIAHLQSGHILISA